MGIRNNESDKRSTHAPLLCYVACYVFFNRYIFLIFVFILFYSTSLILHSDVGFPSACLPKSHLHKLLEKMCDELLSVQTKRTYSGVKGKRQKVTVKGIKVKGTGHRKGWEVSGVEQKNTTHMLTVRKIKSYAISQKTVLNNMSHQIFLNFPLPRFQQLSAKWLQEAFPYYSRSCASLQGSIQRTVVKGSPGNVTPLADQIFIWHKPRNHKHRYCPAAWSCVSTIPKFSTQTKGAQIHSEYHADPQIRGQPSQISCLEIKVSGQKKTKIQLIRKNSLT